jgi:hypothetical protein
MPAAFSLPPFDRRLATGNKLGLHTPPSSRRYDGLLDELGQSLSVAQDSLDFSSAFWFAADGRKGG